MLDGKIRPLLGAAPLPPAPLRRTIVRHVKWMATSYLRLLVFLFFLALLNFFRRRIRTRLRAPWKRSVKHLLKHFGKVFSNV